MRQDPRVDDASASEGSVVPTRLERWVAPPSRVKLRAGMGLMVGAALGLVVAMFFVWYSPRRFQRARFIRRGGN